MSRLGFDVLDHLEGMHNKGVRSIRVEDCAQASSSALRVWEDSNYPYRKDDACSFSSTAVVVGPNFGEYNSSSSLTEGCM